MERVEALARLSSEPVGRLATVRDDGGPHVTVVTFSFSTTHLFTAVDHKPKTTRRLRRLENISRDPRVSFLVDSYDDDWSQLWWVRVDGTAEVHTEGETFDTGIASLVDRYSQYRDHSPEGPLIAIAMERVIGWASNP